MSRLQRLPWSVLLIGIVSLMSGCSLLGQSDVSAVTYVLRATSPGKERPVAEVGKASALKVITGVAAPGYDTDRVLLSRADRSLDFFAASRWVATAPRMLENLAVEVWRAGGVFDTFDATASVPARYALRITVQRFDVEGDAGTPARKVRVKLRGVVQNQADRSIVGDFQAEAEAQVTVERMSAIVASFEVAANDALAQLRDQAAASKTITL